MNNSLNFVSTDNQIFYSSGAKASLIAGTAALATGACVHLYSKYGNIEKTTKKTLQTISRILYWSSAFFLALAAGLEGQARYKHLPDALHKGPIQP